jgi:hypothetical protein
VKQMFAKLMLPLVMATSSVFATTEKADTSSAPKYSNRVVALQPALSYERLGEDSVYFGVESFAAPVWTGTNARTRIGVIEARAGYTFAIDSRSRVTPIVGVSMFRDLHCWKVWQPFDWDCEGTGYSEVTCKYPYIFHGNLGFMAEYDLGKIFSLGLTAKGMMGKVWGSDQTNIKDLSYGLNVSLPLTVRFGKEYNWDLRIEPLAYLLKDYSNFVGGKSTLAYRF